MDKKYQKRIAWACSFLAVLLIFVALPLLTHAQSITNPSIGTFNSQSWYNVLFQWIIGGFGTLVALIGWTLDYSIQNFILGFGAKYKTSNLGFTIDALWGTVRDIFNLTFIFGLIFIGFKMILDAGDSHARKTLVSLIGAALLVNFSLFITKFIVDFSNIAAYKVYEAFQNGSGAPLSISVAFANLLGMPSIFNNSGLATAPASASILYLIGTLLVLLVLAYVYLAGAILIAIRFVVLIIYLVFSPVMFLGWVFPSMHGHSDKYWKGFLSQAFFAPAFLFMLYLSYRVVYNYNDTIQKSFNGTGGGGYFANGTFASADSLIPFFILTMVFLIASMVVAKNMGAVGASSAVKIGHNMRRGLQTRMVTGATYLPRKGLGAGAKWAGEQNDRLEGSRSGRNFKRILSVASLGVLDERGRQGMIKAAKSTKMGGTRSYEDEVKFKEELSATAASEKTKAANKEIIKNGLAAQDPTSTLSAIDKEQAIAKMQSVVSSMGVAQLEKMKDTDRNAIAGEFTTTQVEALMKSEKLGADDKKAISDKRKSVIKAVVENAGGIITTELTKLSVDQLETMGEEFIRTNSHLLTNTQMDEVGKSKKFTETQRGRFTSTRKATQTAAFSAAAPAGSVRALFRHNDATGTSRKPSDIANLGAAVLLDTASLPFLTPDVLEVIADKKTLGSTDRQKLKQKIMTGSRTGQNAVLQGWFMSPEGTHAWK